MDEIGRIVLLQVQRSSLKAGERPNLYYDPAPLQAVAALQLSQRGVAGLGAGQQPLIDVHHADHAHSKHRSGTNGISLGFTSHYRAMRERFGEHLRDGIAGENILIEAASSYTLAELGEHIAIETSSGELIYLGKLLVAAPCVEFSNFAANTGERLPPEALKETLQFLHHGQRGFYASLIGPADTAAIAPSARVFRA